MSDLVDTSQSEVSPIDANVSLLDLGVSLGKPFPVERVSFLPKSPVREKSDAETWKAKAFPFVGVWDYKSRLNGCAFGEWSIADEQILSV